jgi:hypothetical protein
MRSPASSAATLVPMSALAIRPGVCRVEGDESSRLGRGKFLP